MIGETTMNECLLINICQQQAGHNDYNNTDATTDNTLDDKEETQ